MLDLSQQNRINLAVGCQDAELIPKVPHSGTVSRVRGLRCQLMHNGVRILEDAHCGAWMTELIRQLHGHHEPQEEKVFHEVLKHVRPGGVMIELGCWWAYYALWFHQAVPGAQVVLVEPDPGRLETGQRHFELNDAQGRFLQASIGEYSTGPRAFLCEGEATPRSIPRLSLDDLIDQLRIPRVEILHADIQGAELDMLKGAVRSIAAGKIRFVFLSTHHHSISGDPTTHEKCMELVKDCGGRLIAHHNVAESFTGDGLIVASFDPNDACMPEVPIGRNHGRSVYDLEVERSEASRETDALKAKHETLTSLPASADGRGHPIADSPFRLLANSEPESSDTAESRRGMLPRTAETTPAPGPIVSYSMNREDVLLQRAFGNQASGFYVDVGANSPHRFSNTKHFYDRGWHGINIEPSRIFDELAAERPRDINLRLAASDRDGTIDFHECSDVSLSSVRARTLPEGFALAPPAPVCARTLASIFAEHIDEPIDFMSVDVEGHELEVLKGNDWTRFRPRVLIIEASELLSHNSVQENWEPIVLEADYLFAHFDGINRFYVRKEDSELLRHFAFPPTSLEYVAAETIELRQKLSEIERQAARDGRLNIWYDVTTLVVFPGSTGIPRVVTKILEALLQMEHVKTRLCLYDYPKQRFIKVTHKPTRLGKLRAWAKALLRPALQPVRRSWGGLKCAVSRCLSSSLRSMRAWLSTTPWLAQLGKRMRPLVGRIARAVRLLARLPRAIAGFLKDLSQGIRRPHDPAIAARPFLFPFCLLCHNLLKHLPAAAWLRRIGERTRLRQWFPLNIGSGLRVRGVNNPLALSPNDVVVQVGWNPHQQGIAAAKRKQGFRYVSLVHDLIPVKLPHFVARNFPERFAKTTSEQIEISDLILANSECTLRDLEDFARARTIPLPRTHVLRFGSEVNCLARQGATSPVEGVLQDEPFVLTVSTLDPRKNHQTLYLVWRKLAEEFGAKVPKLIIVGYPGLHQLLHEMQFDPLVKGKMLHLFPIDDQQLDWLYQNCMFTAYPSYYEGWGLPVSESLWYGKLCVAADSSSIPEIGGDFVDYHSPYDLAECHRLIRRAAFDADYRRRREEQIATSYRPTTWRECAESLWQALHGRSELSRECVLSFNQNNVVPRSSLKKAG